MNELGHGPWEKGYEPSGINSNLIYECGFNQGYKKAEKDTMEKASKWWREHLVPFLSAGIVDGIIKEFQKAMEDKK